MHSKIVRPVINVWGTATPYGVSRSPPEVCAAVAQALARYSSVRGPLGLGVEQDLHFTARHALSEYARQAQSAGRITA